MPREPSRSRVNDARSRRFRPVRRSNGQGPIWLWGIGAALFVVLVGAAILVVVPSVIGTNNQTPTTRPSNGQPAGSNGDSPSIGETPTTLIAVTPTNTISPSATPLPTAPPQSCRVLQQSWVRSAPREDSIGLALLEGGAPITVIGKIEKDGAIWYRVAEYPPEAYILAQVVQCP